MLLTSLLFSQALTIKKLKDLVQVTDNHVGTYLAERKHLFFFNIKDYKSEKHRMMHIMKFFDTYDFKSDGQR